MSHSCHRPRKAPSREELITDPDHLSNSALFRLSQRELSKRLPISTSTRATFSIYLRWLEVHRNEPSARTEHWSNTCMHWVQSLASKGFGVREVVEEVGKWKVDRERWKTELEMERERRKGRDYPSEREIRKAFEDDPKSHPERKSEKMHSERSYSERMGDRMDESYRSEERRGDSWKSRGDDGWRGEREPRREKEEESRWDSPRDKKHVDKTKFDGKPPLNYICNRCGEPGHHLQVCPTNLDPSYDRPPNDTYVCEVCHIQGDHWKSLCPRNTDPYSIIQKRKAMGISTPPKGGRSRRDDWEREGKAQRDRESERHERRGQGRMPEYSSNSSPSNTPPTVKIDSAKRTLRDIEDQKQRLFREQSDDIGDMIRESTVLRNSDSKRDRPKYETTSIASPSSNTIQARKKVKTESQGLGLDSQRLEWYESPRPDDSYIEDQEQGGDTEMIGDGDHHQESRNSSSSMGFALRPIALSPGSMISDQESSDGTEIDRVISRPQNEYSPFVKHLMRKRPEMNEAVNVVMRRKTAREMWMEADKLRRQRLKTRSPSEVDYGRLTPIVHDEVMTMQFDGACDDFDYDADQTQYQKMTSFRNEPPQNPLANLTPTNLNSLQYQPQTMASNNTTPESTEKPTPRTVHFPPRPSYSNENESAHHRDVASAFRDFTAQQSRNSEAAQMKRASSNGRSKKLQDLKTFANSFKLPTPVPKDLVPLLSNDPQKQKEIREKSGENLQWSRKESEEGDGGKGVEPVDGPGGLSTERK